MPAGLMESGRLHLTLSKASFAQFERTFLEHQRSWLRAAKAPTERLAIKRRTAEDILLGAYGRECTWKQFSRALRRTEKLGYDNVGRRAHVTCLFAMTANQFPDQADRARRKLDEAERRLLALRKDNPTRVEFLEEISRIRRMARWKAPVPRTR
ncbi:hypothetical protein [Myxococcus xanthus]|uniref:hypothetical protein n=1 Tax=Myxococcus xanthus TaxID=34 RepID=UPI0002F094AD|nr:hypothetical protein [Myxococcus xanthus]QVW70558.1 hypothetical protein JTM82_13835 [Myxococcus xanthus DZ2]QZZ49448.1 hypothetical protein MyxoNM_09565 [Myxococcus xanthus]UEO03315.1 hypothetical protein K1515_28980 [Myxococcus xanthus DZ2]UYI16524.1 hypothetical protein N3T43_09455 [Myxococcus xanthus]UYI23887.1 hypothetical protein N1129_09460 [Myxococcus xanthus]